MSVLLDTSVLSLALRRTRPDLAEAKNVGRLLRTGNVALLGVVRQELLSGIRSARSFERLRDQLRALPDHPLETQHYERAAEFYNTCRGRGIQGSLVDFLLCAASAIDELPIYSADLDFDVYMGVLPITLYRTTSE